MFEYPVYVGALLFLYPLLGLFFIWRNRVRKNAIKSLGNPDLVRMLTSQVSEGRRRIKTFLWLLTVSGLMISLANPIVGTQAEVVESLGAEIVFVVDVSASMDAEDVLPSRLQRARLDMNLMLNGLEGNNIAMVLFTNIAQPYLPMTFDTRAAGIFLDSVTTRAISQQGTAIGNAIRTAQNSFVKQSDIGQHIVLLTDGENHEDDALQAAREASDSGIRVHVIGYGSDTGALIPVYDENNQLIDYKTFQGGLVESRINEDLLMRVAELGSGRYINALNASVTDIEALIDQIAGSQGGVLSEEVILRPVTQAHLVLVLVILLLSAEILFSEARLSGLSR